MISEAQSRIQRENCMVKSENRLPSLDVFRGLAIICMLLVNSLPDFEHAYPLLVHSEWAGITLADLAFPGFIFAMGASGTFFFGKHQHEGFTGKFMLLLRRGFLLFALGIVINQFELLLSHVMHTAPEGVSLWQDILVHGRILGVLQRLGMVYFCGMLIVWWLKKERFIWLMAMLLLFVSSLGFHVYAPVEPFSPIDNISMMVDQAWPGQSHCYLGAAFDPEGLYGSLGATSSMLLGMLAGQRLTARRSQDFILVREFFGLGGILLILGFGWSFFDIISKPLWTAPYVLITSGFFMWLLALLLTRASAMAFFTAFCKRLSPMWWRHCCPVIGFFHLFAWGNSHCHLNSFPTLGARLATFAGTCAFPQPSVRSFSCKDLT